MKGRILVVDDEKNLLLVIQAMLENDGFEVIPFSSSEEAMEAIETEELDCVISDLYMPGPGGMDVLAFVRARRPNLPVAIITAFGTIESAVAALKNGAFDFITKPFDQKDLLSVVKKAVATSRALESEPQGSISDTRSSNGDSSKASDLKSGETSIRAKSSSMQEVVRIITKVAPTDSTVLLSGESGTGKEIVASEIHRLSKRVDQPFIKINCAVIPSDLLESELFGHEKGAFTGAIVKRPGRFELAHEGTLFLDEIAEIPLEMQAKLLRAIQEREFERVGGVETVRVDVRLIAAANRDLGELVKAGRFREDLYYRLNVVPLTLPPLRERKEDIEDLAFSSLERVRSRISKKIDGISDEVLGVFNRYTWPGNIRQLENVVERMALLTEESELGLQDLPEELAVHVPVNQRRDLSKPESFKEVVRRRTQDFERDLIEKELASNDGNVTRTAEKLGLSRKGLQLKMKELGIRR